MIFIAPASSATETSGYFSGKRTSIGVVSPLTQDADAEFCTCLVQCVPNLPAFTDEVGDDYWKNDRFRQYLNTVKSGTVNVTLYKNGEAIATGISGSTYGDENSSTTPNYYTYYWSFFKIWDNHGYGDYQFKIENLNAAGNVVQTDLSPVFTLGKFTEERANNTVRIETEQLGNLQHLKQYYERTGSGKVNPRWEQQIRLRGSLKYSENVIENDYVISNLDSRNSIQVKDQLKPGYVLELRLLDSAQSFPVLFDYLFSETVKISDYNVYNFVHQVDKPNTRFYRSIPLKRTSTEFSTTRKAKRKTFRIPMEYDNRNVFKTNN